MSVSKRLNLQSYAARAAAFLTVLTGSAFVVSAQTPPYALLQYSALTGSGNTITATQVPVVTATGVTVYVNLALQFSVDSNGNLTLSPGYPQVIPAPVILSSGFKAGTYTGPFSIRNGSYIVTVGGPGVTDGGATEWSLAATTGASGDTYPASATWYVGPIASNPLAARLNSAGITSTAWSYGVSSSSSGDDIHNNWQTNTLIGVSQAGNTITIVSFTQNKVDKSVPVDQITYTLKQ
jgi:hypothetical protein